MPASLKPSRGLRDLGNTVIVVEHDEAVMRASDHVIDMGPGAGEHGGWVVVSGTLDDVIASEESITGAYLSGRRKIPMREVRRQPARGPRTRRSQRARQHISTALMYASRSAC